jgi:rhodanese-related sulfurtransferase
LAATSDLQNSKRTGDHHADHYRFRPRQHAAARRRQPDRCAHPGRVRRRHAKGATNIPLDRLDPSSLAYCNGNTVYFICKSGIRAQKAMEKLAESGFSNMVQVEGGTDAWIDARLPVLQGQEGAGPGTAGTRHVGGMSLTGAGIVMAGQPLGLAIVAAMGAGMIYAGITNSCGMATLLAKAPWNQNAKVPACRHRRCPPEAVSKWRKTGRAGRSGQRYIRSDFAQRNAPMPNPPLRTGKITSANFKCWQRRAPSPPLLILSRRSRSWRQKIPRQSRPCRPAGHSPIRH